VALPPACQRRTRLSQGSIPQLVERAPSGTVLVVEDDHDVRVSIRALLEGEGYTVLSVTHGRNALELLEVTSPKPQLIILDLNLPVMDGWEFVARACQRPELAEIPIVVLSAIWNRPPPGGTVAFLRKPFSLDALVRVVAEYCRSDAKPGVTQAGELPPPEKDDGASDFDAWRATYPHGVESLRWESTDGRWIAVTIGTGSALGTVEVTDSTGSTTIVDSYEAALALATHWQRQRR
jgi:CheY-like chemotaxis protein